jgi:hypothetical protein
MRLLVRWTPTSTSLIPNRSFAGGNHYPFDPTSGPGYVWHCHIIDHEDSEMMRPYGVVKQHPLHDNPAGGQYSRELPSLSADILPSAS